MAINLFIIIYTIMLAFKVDKFDYDSTSFTTGDLDYKQLGEVTLSMDTSSDDDDSIGIYTNL